MKISLAPDEAIAHMLDRVGDFLPGHEFCPLEQLDGRILAETIRATISLPVFDNSAMDGYAIRYADAACLHEGGLTIVGTVFAGHAWADELKEGQAVGIMTGAPLPVGADTVLIQEFVTVRDGCLFSDYYPQSGEHVRLRGEDMDEGEELLTPGVRLTPRHIGLIAGLGISQVRVYKLLRIALFSSGDELRQPDELLGDGQIYDSNRYALMAMLKRLPVNVIISEWLPDTPHLVEERLYQASEHVDVIITSAGVSVGNADYMRDIILRLGSVDFWKVSMKPGKPFTFGRLADSWYLGLPGNPVSSLVTMDQLAQPFLRRLCGETIESSFSFTGIAGTALDKKPGRCDYSRGTLMNINGQLQARLTGRQGSGLLRGFCFSDCYIILEQERSDVAAGEPILIQPFGLLLG